LVNFFANIPGVEWFAMSHATEFPKLYPSIWHKMFRYLIALAWVVFLALALLGAVLAFKRYPQLFNWKLQLEIGLTALFALAVLWKIPQWQVRKLSDLTPKDRFDRINEARKTLAQILGGIAFLFGFYATVQNIHLAQNSFELNQKGQITDRLTKAIDQLGAVDSKGQKKMEVRLGGIYALERIARESEQDHWPIMQVLNAYVRTNAHATRQGSGQPVMEPLGVEPETDIQAVLTVLATRNVASDPKDKYLDLHETNLAGAYIPWGNLGGADLSGSFLNGTDLGMTNLRESKFIGAQLNGANLSNADLSDAHLNGQASLIEAKLYSAVLIHAHLDDSDLTGAILSSAKLNGAELGDARLRGADLMSADLTEAICVRTDFTKAVLVGATMKSAILSEANLSGAVLVNTELQGVDLTTAKNLTQEQVDSAKGDSNTKLPAGLHIPESWKQPRQ
jgi:uncharacterized protein YjbI with pentapeptide repeats